MSIANIGNELNNMIPADAANSTSIQVIYENADGIVLACAKITALGTLSAFCSTPGLRFATNCLIIATTSNQAHNSCSWLVNTAASTSAPTFSSISAFVV